MYAIKASLPPESRAGRAVLAQLSASLATDGTAPSPQSFAPLHLVKCVAFPVPSNLRLHSASLFILFYFFGSIQSKNHYVAPRVHPQLALCNPQYEKATRNICVQLHLKKKFSLASHLLNAHTHTAEQGGSGDVVMKSHTVLHVRPL